ncbi:MAG: HPF/RaiA family ribosome-associated protein [Pseudomonas sp.]
MQIQINTDNHIQGDEQLTSRVESSVRNTLQRFSDQITRVEVHLRDENSAAKSGPADKRCQLEVRLAGRQPTSVTEVAASIDQAVSGAAQKMVRSLETTLGKLGRS